MHPSTNCDVILVAGISSFCPFVKLYKPNASVLQAILHSKESLVTLMDMRYMLSIQIGCLYIQMFLHDFNSLKLWKGEKVEQRGGGQNGAVMVVGEREWIGSGRGEGSVVVAHT